MINATILNTLSLSSAADLGALRLVGIEMPAGWTAASLTFQVAFDGITYYNLYDATGIEVEKVVAASRYIELNPTEWAGIRFIKIRSGTSGVPVNQLADRTFSLVCRDTSR